MKRMYFAHPINTFDTNHETKSLELIKNYFPDGEIVNPNEPHHQLAYAEWKKKYKEKMEQGMSYYFEIVLPSCHGCFALPFLDGKFGAGVAGEAGFFIERKQEVFVINLAHMIIGPMNDGETGLIREWIETTRALGRPHTVLDRNAYERVGNSLVLSIAETHFRTWGRGEPYKIMVPFEYSHLV